MKHVQTPATATIAIYALTRRGATLGAAIAEQLEPEFAAQLYTPARLQLHGDHPFDSLMDLVARQFTRFDGHVFITAAGICVRAIAPHLQRKDVDPAVIVMDQEGANVISLLAGHLGGANNLATTVARLTGGTPIITTATDTAGLPSLDMMARQHGLTIGNLEAVKTVNSALLDGTTVQVYDPDERLGPLPSEHFRRVTDLRYWNEKAPGVWVDWKASAPGLLELRLYPRRVFVGMGCRRGVPAGEIMAHLLATLEQGGVAVQSVAGISTIEEKRDETGLIETGHRLNVPMHYFTKDQLDEVKNVSASPLVQKHMGVGSVCEAAAVLASSGELIMNKQKTERVTCALAISSS